MIFDPKKGGGHFFDIFDPRTPPPPTHLPQNLKKVGFKCGGGGRGGSGAKTHWGMRLLEKIMIFTRG